MRSTIEIPLLCSVKAAGGDQRDPSNGRRKVPAKIKTPIAGTHSGLIIEIHKIYLIQTMVRSMRPIRGCKRRVVGSNFRPATRGDGGVWPMIHRLIATRQKKSLVWVGI